MKVVYSAAHAGFSDLEPLGGGQAVAEWLIREWDGHEQFSLDVISPMSLGLKLSKPLTQMKELEYARFCREYETAATQEILTHDPTQCTVLNNDISESPNLSILSERGYQVVTIVHVDVVEYVSKFYLRGLFGPEKIARLYRISGLLPDVVRLVIEKQYDCILHSTRVVVPSQPMKDVLLCCYPWCDPRKFPVIPWGNISPANHKTEIIPVSIEPNEFVIMTMSRLSPEKGIEHCIGAMRFLVTHGHKLRLLICGAAAYMKGVTYEQKLKKLAARVTGIHIEFPGHVTGQKKSALLYRTNLFISPSQHESYGLALAEAEAAGCPIISHPHYGARGTIVDCTNHRALAKAISQKILKYSAGSIRQHTLSVVDSMCAPVAHERLAELMVMLQETELSIQRKELAASFAYTR